MGCQKNTPVIPIHSRMEIKFSILFFSLFIDVFAAASQNKRKSADTYENFKEEEECLSKKSNTSFGVSLDPIPDDFDTSFTDIELSSPSSDSNKSSPVMIDIPVDFDPAEYSDLGSFKDNYVWDTTLESEWTLSDLEWIYFYLLKSDESIENIQNNLSVFNDSKYIFGSNWPYLGPERSTSKLFRIYHECALRWLLVPRQLKTFRKYCDRNLIDLTLPIYERKSDKYLSYLSMAISCAHLNEEQFDTLLKYLPKHMLDHPDSKGVLPLTAAISKNRLDLVQKLVEAGADINKIVEGKLTPVMEAVALKHWNIVDYFVTKDGFDPNFLLTNGVSLMLVYCRNNPKFDFYRFKQLFCRTKKLRHEILINDLSVFYRENYSFFELVLTEIITKNNFFTQIVIFHYFSKAILSCDFLVINFLRSLNVPVLDLTQNGMTFLHITAALGLSESVKFLISVGADVDELTQNEQELSPIQLAFINNHYTLVCELVDLGATVGVPEIEQRAIESGITKLIEAKLTQNIVYLSKISNLNYKKADK